MICECSQLFSYTKEECTLSDPEDKEIEGNAIKEHPDVPAADTLSI